MGMLSVSSNGACRCRCVRAAEHDRLQPRKLAALLSRRRWWGGCGGCADSSSDQANVAESVLAIDLLALSEVFDLPSQLFFRVRRGWSALSLQAPARRAASPVMRGRGGSQEGLPSNGAGRQVDDMNPAETT